MDIQRDKLLQQLWDAQSDAYRLMCEYVSLPHRYGDNTLYHAEGHIVDLIAAHPGITITDLANTLKKTTSACSQIVAKLKAKGWVIQVRNQDNNRQFNLSLTDSGLKIYQDHQAFIQTCQQETYRLLDRFTDDELEQHILIQQVLNLAYQGDVRHSHRDRD